MSKKFPLDGVGPKTSNDFPKGILPTLLYKAKLRMSLTFTSIRMVSKAIFCKKGYANMGAYSFIKIFMEGHCKVGERFFAKVTAGSIFWSSK